MGSSPCFQIFAALLLILAVRVHGAPAGARIHRQLNYGAGKDLALQLNSGARELYRELKIQVALTAVTDPPLMIRPEDQCDPESLLNSPEPCLLKMALALKNYSRIFGDVGLFQQDVTDIRDWKPSATALSEVMKTLLGEMKEQSEDPEPLNVENWMVKDLFSDSVSRLYSFSIITARVFSFLSHQQS